MNKINKIIFTVFFLLLAIAAESGECPVCHAANIPALAMNCPDCNANMHDVAANLQNTHASLKVRVLYTGDSPDRLPAYGKLHINGKYHGNIDLIDKQEKSTDLVQAWDGGLGDKFSAYYEKNLDKVPPGVLKIEIEMKFDRFYGLARSFKKVIFPYVSFKEGEKTVVEHYFNSAATFHEYKPGKRTPLPVVSDAKIQGASGTVALNIGLFK